jgi:WD40 repeat protein
LAAVAPGRHLVANVKQGFTISLKDWKSGGESGMLDGHPRWGVTAVAFSPDELTFATAGREGALRLWDVAALKERGRLVGHHGPVQCMVFLPDGKSLITGSWDRTVRLWDIGTRTNQATIHLKDRIQWLAISPDGKRFAVQARETGEVRDCETGKIVATFPSIKFASGGLFSPDGRRLAVIRNWSGENNYSVTILNSPQ